MIKTIEIWGMKITCEYNEDSCSWMLSIDKAKGVVIQVKNLEDAPKELAKSFEVLLAYKLRE